MPIIGRSLNLKELLRGTDLIVLCLVILLSCISLFALQPLVAGLWKVWTMEPPIIAVLLFHWIAHKDTEILAASIPTSVAVAVAAFSVSLSLLYLVESAWLHSWSQRTLFHADVLIPTNDNRVWLLWLERSLRSDFLDLFKAIHLNCGQRSFLEGKVSTVDRYSVSKQGGEAVSKDQLRI